MAHGKHPLDVFRSSSSGFPSASKRRTVPGRVISRSARPGSADDGQVAAAETQEAAPARKEARPPAAAKTPPAPKAPRRAPGRTTAGSASPPPGAKRRMAPLLRPRAGGAGVAKRLTQAVFPLAVLAMAALAVWVVMRTDWTGAGTALKAADPTAVLDAGPGGEVPAAAVDAWFTIRVGTYNASGNGMAAAWAARDELAARGLPVFDPVGLEEQGEDGQVVLTEVHLLVGQARTREELAGLLGELQAIADWPSGDPRPFLRASIVTHPAPPAG